MKFRLTRGFTLIELMIVVAIIGILASVAIPAFMKYIRRAKTTEAAMNLRKLYDSAVAYQASEHASANGDVLLRQWPGDEYSTPFELSACDSPGQKYAPNPSYWHAPAWQALNFSVDDPFYYNYDWDPFGGDGSVVGHWFEVVAQGDLDCDDVLSDFRRRGTVDTQYSIRGGSALQEVNPLEQQRRAHLRYRCDAAWRVGPSQHSCCTRAVALPHARGERCAPKAEIGGDQFGMGVAMLSGISVVLTLPRRKPCLNPVLPAP